MPSAVELTAAMAMANANFLVLVQQQVEVKGLEE